MLEYVDGAPPRGPLTSTEAVRLGLQIVSALEAAHHRRIRALEIEPSESDPHFLLGTLASVHDYDWKAAADEFSKAMSGSALSANARWAYATFYLGALGRYEESAAEMRRAALLALTSSLLPRTSSGIGDR